jgi:hypothetical protein
MSDRAPRRWHDLAGKFGVLAVVEYKLRQAERPLRRKLSRQRHYDVRGRLDADDSSGRTGPAYDLRDPTLLRGGGSSSVSLLATLGASKIIR